MRCRYCEMVLLLFLVWYTIVALCMRVYMQACVNVCLHAHLLTPSYSYHAFLLNIFRICVSVRMLWMLLILCYSTAVAVFPYKRYSTCGLPFSWAQAVWTLGRHNQNSKAVSITLKIHKWYIQYLFVFKTKTPVISFCSQQYFERKCGNVTFRKASLYWIPTRLKIWIFF